MSQLTAMSRRATAAAERLDRLVPSDLLAGNRSGDDSRAPLVAPRRPRLATTFTVNSTADDPISSPTSKLCHATNGKCTLRAAVTAADNLGKAVNIKLSPFHYVLDDTTDGTMVITDPGAVTIEGVSPSKTIISVLSGDHIEPLEVTDNSKSQGGVLFLSGLTIEDGFAPAGGALAVEATTASAVLTNVVLRSNRATGAGGAIASEGHLWVTQSTIIGNRATSMGGGIASEGGIVVVVSSIISHNVTTEDGGGLFVLEGSASITGGSVSSNTAGSSTTPGFGGGIVAIAVDLNVNGTTVNSNKVLDDGTGGGIVVDEAELTMRGGQLSHNSAPGTGLGGAAFFSVGLATLTDVNIDSNTGGVGGILADEGLPPATEEGTPTVVDITGGTLSDNTSIAAVAVAAVAGSEVNLDIAGAVLDGNTTSGSVSCAAAVCGEAVSAGAVGLTLTNDTIEKNTVKPKTEIGGAIEAVTSGGSLSLGMQGDTVDFNSAPGAPSSAGAVLLASVSDPSATPPTFSPLSVTITDSSFEHDSVGAGGDGGAIGVATASGTSSDVAEASVSMANDTFEHDSTGVTSSAAISDGGAVSIGPETTGSITGSTFADNAAKGKSGGAGAVADLDEAAFSYANDTFTSNSAGELAGALAVESGAATITKSSFSDNHAGQLAPTLALFMSVFSVSDSTFSGGTVSILAGLGGGIWLETSSGSISNSTISGNSAGKNGDGGAIFDGGGDLTLDSDTITSNVAKAGSALFTDASGQLVTVRDSIISHNTTRAVGGTENDCGLSTMSPDIAIAASSEGGNVLGMSQCVVQLGPGDTISKTPMLGPLANNGGPTKTMKPGTSSPARKIGLACLPTDQRGHTRPPTNCDSGSYELVTA
jgi:CSLREA domain-containing protein